MTKRTVEMDDTLQDRVDSAIEDVKSELIEYLDQNPDTDKTPCISNDLDYSGAIHEIIDSATPIYTKEIEDNFYLHGDDIEQAFDDADIGTKEDKGWPCGWKAAAICCYIEQAVHKWYHKEADDIFADWCEKHPACEECGNRKPLHKVKTVDDSSIGSMMVCEDCDEDHPKEVDTATKPQ